MSDELRSVKDHLLAIKKFAKSKEDRTVESITNVLVSQHIFSYYLVLHGMEKVQDTYCDKMLKRDFRACIDYIQSFSGRTEGLVVPDGGASVKPALTDPSKCDVECDMYQDYQEFSRTLSN